MATNPQRHAMTVAEYLAFDRTSETKHEYIDGEVFNMAGGTILHNSLCGNVYYRLREQLGGRGPCRVYNTDTRVKVSPTKYVYPDCVVSCDVADHQGANDIVESPRLVVEVISKTTEETDRNAKLKWYQSIPSLAEYMIVNTKYQLVELWQRNGETWAYQSYQRGESIEIQSLDVSVTVDDLYEGQRVGDEY